MKEIDISMVQENHLVMVDTSFQLTQYIYLLLKIKYLFQMMTALFNYLNFNELILKLYISDHSITIDTFMFIILFIQQQNEKTIHL